MMFWAVAMCALVGWILADFDGFGFIFGGVVGLPIGAWLRGAVRAEVAREVRRMMDAMPLAASAAPPDTALHPQSEPLPEPQDLATPEPEREAPLVEAVEAPAIAQEWPEDRVTAAATTPREPYVAQPSLAEQAVARARDWLLGGNTIVRVGLVILFIGLVFLARLAINAGLFPIEARLALVAAAGAALLGVGFSRRVVRPAFGLALQGTGVAVLYLTVFAAAKAFGVLPPLAAFVFMILFAALGVALALLQNARGMALASFLGGFAVPILLGGEAETPIGLFTYYTVLNAAILVIAWKKSWRELNLLGFFATFSMAALWGASAYADRHYLICQVFLAITMAIYLAMALLYAHNTPGKLGNAADSTLLFGPALAGFGLEVGLVSGREFGSAFAAVVFGAVYLGVAAWAMRKRREEMRLLNECLLAIGVGFVTLAVPLALDAQWTSAAWALEGAGAFWVGKRQARWMPRLFGLLLQAVAALIVLTMLKANVASVPLANNGFVAPMLVALPLLLTAWWMRDVLPHSGSRLAVLYGKAENDTRYVPFFAAFLFATIAVAQEASRRLPAATADRAALAVFTPSGQVLVVMLAILALMALGAWFSRRKSWAVATWPAHGSLLLIGASLMGTFGLGRHVLFQPDWMAWAAALTLHFAMLRAADRAAADAPQSPLKMWNTIIHAAGAWLLTAMLADSLSLAIDRGGLWNTSWSGVIFLVSAVAVLGLLNRWAGAAAPLADLSAKRWPLNPAARSYWIVAATPLAVLAWSGAVAAALFAEGVTDPLPYIPLLNPVDLAVLLALVVLALWRRTILSAVELPKGMDVLKGPLPLVAAAVLVFVELNGIWLRTAHHWLGVGWGPIALGESAIVQTGLAILWTLLAMGLMLFAKRRGWRISWLTGAALLAVVVVKLVLVDMSRAQSWERIVTFIGVGVLMLVIGYFVPLPPRQQEEKAA